MPRSRLPTAAAAALALWSPLLIGSRDALGSDPERLPRIEGEIPLEIQSDRACRSSGGENQTHDLYATIEPVLRLRFTPRLSLETALVLEPVFESGGRSRFFEDQGLFVEQLFLEYATGAWGVRAGKINPPFGIAWDAAPGIYGVDFAEDYEITERLGLGGFVRFGNERVGFHRLTADAFLLDTSPLSESVFTGRGRVRRSDGGPSNTGDLRSFALTLAGEAIPGLPGLGYHLGFTQQSAGRRGRDERGYALGLTYGASPFENVEVELLSEYVYQQGAGGARQDRHYLTQSAAIHWKGWNLALCHARRHLHVHGGGHLRDDLVQASAGYEFEMGLAIDVGWRHAREDGIRKDGIGMRIRYSVQF
jgi:hypothetical protein